MVSDAMRSVVVLAWIVVSPVVHGCVDPPDPPWRTSETSTDAVFRDVYFLDAKRGWIVGGGHNVEGGIFGQTRDGGETWTFRTGIVPNPRSRLFHLNAIRFRDSLRGVIAADGGRLLRTVDGGQNWHALIGNAGRSLADLFFLDDDTGWAVGDEWVLGTNDGGETWRRLNEGDQASDDFRARSVFFIDAWRGWLVGHHGALRQTRDGGRYWSKVVSMPELGVTMLSAVHFWDEKTGWVVGEEGTILHTSDGGKSWNIQSIPIPADLNDVHFVSQGTGWVIGFDPSTGISPIFRTDDSGAHWRVEAAIAGESLQALFFHDEHSGIAVGDRVRRHPQRVVLYSTQPSTSSSRAAPASAQSPEES